MESIPVLTTGRGELVGRSAIEMLKPEVEVIHFTLAEAIDAELPDLLAGKVPKSPSSTLGTGNWTSPPRALLLGGAYSDSDIARLKKLVNQTEGARQVPWLRVDSSRPAPPMGPEYAAAVAARAKDGLRRLQEEQKLDRGDDGVYLI